MAETITQIGRYEISRQLVETALASVYDAFDPVERKSVAIRVPRTTQHGIGDSGLKHPGLMKVLSCEQSQGESFLVLEPFKGTPLDGLIHQGRKMQPVEALEPLRQLASVLDYAHSQGMLHGCLHPSSILIDESNQIKVLDLGSPHADRAVSPEQLLRAVHYLSPECIRDQPLDGRCDQFSLAVLAHAMLTGELPFSGKPLGAMFRIAYQKLERDAIREFPAAAQSVLQRALSKRPSDRYATCGEMVDALAGAFSIRPAPALTRLADASEFVDPRPIAAAHAAENRSWTRHFSGEALKYFGATFVAIGLMLAALLYLVMPKAPPKPVPVPVVEAPAAPVSTPAAVPPHPAPKAEAKAKPKYKKKEPEVDLKPVEPKIIHP